MGGEQKINRSGGGIDGALQVKSEMKGFTAELEQQSLREQKEQAQEIQFSGQLQTEQAKLSELSDQLNELDKRLQEDHPRSLRVRNSDELP